MGAGQLVIKLASKKKNTENKLNRIKTETLGTLNTRHSSIQSSGSKNSRLSGQVTLKVFLRWDSVLLLHFEQLHTPLNTHLLLRFTLFMPIKIPQFLNHRASYNYNLLASSCFNNRSFFSVCKNSISTHCLPNIEQHCP